MKNKDALLNQRIMDKQRVKEKYSTKIQTETDKMSKELESKLRRQRELLQVQSYNFKHLTQLLIFLDIYLESNERSRR